MEIITDYQNREEWDKFVAENTQPSSFLQSFAWGEFNEKILGNPVIRWAVVDQGALSAVFQAIIKKLPFNKTYVYCPRGLVWRQNCADCWALAYGEILKKIRVDWTGHIFLRASPPDEDKEDITGFIRQLGFRKPKILSHGQEPAETVLINLEKSEEELLASMQQKTRYNIRLAEKKGVEVKCQMSPPEADPPLAENIKNQINTFYKLAEETAKRNKIKIYQDDYYKKLVEYFGQGDKNIKLKLYLAQKKEKTLAAIMVIYFGNGATYLHGASSNDGRELMPNYLLQWQAMREAKKEGYKIYDLWGVSGENKTWAGITRFKRGFDGREIKFMGSWDYVLNKKWYNIFRLLKIIKKIIP